MLLALILLVGHASFLCARTVVLSWNPNTEADLAGYIVFVGAASRNYSESHSVGKVNEYELNLPDDGLDYFLALKAFDESGNKSAFSAEVKVDGDPDKKSPAAGDYAPLYAFGQSVSYCSQTPCAGAENCQANRYPCGDDFPYKYTDMLYGFRNLYDLNEPKILCGREMPDDATCEDPVEKTISLGLGTLHQNGLDYVSSFPDTFRIFIPPGTIYGYVNIYMPIDGQEGIVVRYKRPPTGEYCQYAGQPAHYGDVPWDVPNRVSLSTMEQRDVYLRNWGGLAAAVSPFSLQIPLSEADSGWLYIKKLPFASSTIHKVTASFRVDVSIYKRWYNRAVWDVAGNPWSADHGEIVAAACSNANPDACRNARECEQAGGYWYGNHCNAENSCTVDDFDLCDSQSRCNNSGFYWYDEACNEEPACTSADLSICDSQNKCESAGYYWDGSYCRASSPCRRGVLSACGTPDDCQSGGGVWYSGDCHQAASSSGSSSSYSGSSGSSSSSSSSSSSTPSSGSGSFSGLGSLFGLQRPSCGPDHLDACAQAECEGLGSDYWWDGSCRYGQQQESYDGGRIAEAPVRLGDGANDGRISTGDGLSFILDVSEGVRTYALVVFPNDAGAYFIDNNSLLNQQLVSVRKGQLQVTDNLCGLLNQYPDLKVLEGSWWVAFLTTPAAAGDFHSLDELAAYINSGGVYHFGSYHVTVGCQD